MPPIEYDIQLDSLDMVRLIISAQGTDDLFEVTASLGQSKNGMRDLHFGFVKATDDNHGKKPRNNGYGREYVCSIQSLYMVLRM